MSQYPAGIYELLPDKAHSVQDEENPIAIRSLKPGERIHLTANAAYSFRDKFKLVKADDKQPAKKQSGGQPDADHWSNVVKRVGAASTVDDVRLIMAAEKGRDGGPRDEVVQACEQRIEVLEAKGKEGEGPRLENEDKGD